VRATAEHIGDLLVEDLTADTGSLRSALAHKLQQAGGRRGSHAGGNEYRSRPKRARMDDEFRKRENQFRTTPPISMSQRDQLLSAEVDQALKGIS